MLPAYSGIKLCYSPRISLPVPPTSGRRHDADMEQGTIHGMGLHLPRYSGSVAYSKTVARRLQQLREQRSSTAEHSKSIKYAAFNANYEIVPVAAETMGPWGPQSRDLWRIQVDELLGLRGCPDPQPTSAKEFQFVFSGVMRRRCLVHRSILPLLPARTANGQIPDYVSNFMSIAACFD